MELLLQIAVHSTVFFFRIIIPKKKKKIKRRYLLLHQIAYTVRGLIKLLMTSCYFAWVFQLFKRKGNGSINASAPLQPQSDDDEGVVRIYLDTCNPLPHSGP